MVLYSKLASKIHEKINREHVDLDEVSVLIKESYEYAVQSSSSSTQLLHNALIDFLLLKYPGLKVSGIVEEYLIFQDSGRVINLEKHFAKDPSDYKIVYELAIEYGNAGKQERARQLLERVAESEYREKQRAIFSLRKIVKGEGGDALNTK